MGILCSNLRVFNLCSVFQECIPGIKQNMPVHLFVSPAYFRAAVFFFFCWWGECCLKFSCVLWSEGILGACGGVHLDQTVYCCVAYLSTWVRLYMCLSPNRDISKPICHSRNFDSWKEQQGINHGTLPYT